MWATDNIFSSMSIFFLQRQFSKKNIASCRAVCCGTVWNEMNDNLFLGCIGDLFDESCFNCRNMIVISVHRWVKLKEIWSFFYEEIWAAVLELFWTKHAVKYRTVWVGAIELKSVRAAVTPVTSWTCYHVLSSSILLHVPNHS